MIRSLNNESIQSISETGGICISPRPSAPGAEIRPGMPMRPMFGIWPVIVDEKVTNELIILLFGSNS